MNDENRRPPLKILVVENHPDTLKWLLMYLEQCGHQPVSASSVQQALEILQTAECDMLISDIGLPDGSGWDLLEQAPSSRPLFAVAMSGFGTHGDRLKSKSAGYRAHLLKPFLPDQLDELIEEARKMRFPEI